jgi:hypothetical protein
MYVLQLVHKHTVTWRWSDCAVEMQWFSYEIQLKNSTNSPVRGKFRFCFFVCPTKPEQNLESSNNKIAGPLHYVSRQAWPA